MTNEIKEILNDLQRVADRKCYPEDILDGSIAQEWLDYIEDYITNLQQRIDKATNYILENICCDTRVYTKNENVYKVVDILRGDE